MKIFNNKYGKISDFLMDATNVYRTKDYIVKQVIVMSFNDRNYDQLVSYDTFYLRTKERDRKYEYYFDCRNDIDGKRIRTAMFSRKYVN